jgi:endonuclease/exonuclease/phosphatase family metal-dependent hydrolase
MNTLADYTNFYNELEVILQKFNNKENTILCGDFNIDLLKMEEKPIFQQFFELLLTNSYVTKITLPTRLSGNSKTLIDNIAVKLTHNFSSTTSGVHLSNISDHLPCFTILDYLSLS